VSPARRLLRITMGFPLTGLTTATFRHRTPFFPPPPLLLRPLSTTRPIHATSFDTVGTCAAYTTMNTGIFVCPPLLRLLSGWALCPLSVWGWFTSGRPGYVSFVGSPAGRRGEGVTHTHRLRLCWQAERSALAQATPAVSDLVR